MNDRQRMPKGTQGGTGGPRRKIRFVEAGVLFALILTLVVIAGLQLTGGGTPVAEPARAARTVEPAVVAVLEAAPADPTPAEPTGRPGWLADRLRPVTYEEAEQAYQAGRHAEAAELFAAYAELKPGNAWGHYMLGLSRWKAGDPDGAREALEQAIAIKPDHFKSRQNLARVLLDLGRAADALPHAEFAVAADPLAPDTWRVLGRALDESGRRDEALEAYASALRLDPDDAWSLNNLGFILVRQDRCSEALPALARAATLRPGEARFQNNLGVALERTGHLQAAVEAYAAALAADPRHERAGASLARLEPVAAGRPGGPVDLPALAAAFTPAPPAATAAVAEELGETAPLARSDSDHAE